MRKASVVVALTLLILAGMSASARAENVSWAAPVSGNWNDGTKWSSGMPPMAGDDVFITVDGTYTVTLTANPAAFASLTVGTAGNVGEQTLVATGRTIPGAGPLLVNASGRLQGGVTIALTGADPRVSLVGGDFEIAANSGIVGGILEYAGGSIAGNGTLTLSGAQMMLTSAYENNVTLNVTNSSIVSGLTLTNNASMSDFGNTGTPRFLCPVVNSATGFISIQTGNGGSDYRFEHVEGLVNMGIITAGSTGNGSNAMTVPNGPFRNRGMFNTRDSRGAPIVVTAELINEPGATFENTPGVGARLLLGRAGAHHVNRGTFRGVESVTQSGADPSFRQEAGVIDLSRHLSINGGTFEYAGGSISGAGTMSFGGVQIVLTSPYENNVTFSVSSNSVVSGLTLTNNATLSDFGDPATPRFLCPVVNSATGFISIRCDNAGSNYRFEHSEGLVNMGTITAGSTGNGSNAMTVPNGPFTNHGLFNTRDSRGAPIVVTAELINEATGTFENTPGVGARLLLGRAGAHHVNRGTVRGVESVTQSGTDPSFRQEAGVIDLNRNLSVSGGTFQYAGGSIAGAGTLSFGGVQIILSSPYENNVTFNVSNNSVVSGMTLTNNATLSDFGDPATPRFLCPVVNSATGFISIRCDNAGSNYRFEHPSGLINEGTLTIGSSGNGANRLTIAPGRLINRGLIDTRDSRGATQVIDCELMNEAGGVLQTTPGINAPIRLQRTGAAAHHVNAGTIRTNASRLDVVLPGGSRFENASTGVVSSAGVNTQISFASDGAPHAGPWFTNHGLVETLGVDSIVSIPIGPGRSMINEPSGTLRATAGIMVITNNGTMQNLGFIELLPTSTLRIIGTAPSNFDPITQRWHGGRMRIVAPGGIFCTVLSSPLRNIDALLECVHGEFPCDAGGTPDIFAHIEEVGPDGHFTLDDMPMTTAGDLTVNGTAMFVNGAVLNVPGRLHSNGTLVIHNSTVIPQSVLIGQGQFVGAGQVQGNIVNNGGRVRPGQSPGRFDAMQGYTQGAAASLEIEIGGNTPETEYDVLAVGTTATLGGTIEVLLLNDFVPAVGDQFIVVQAASVVGRFDTEQLPAGLYLDYRSTEVRVFRPCRADWNHSNLTSVQDIFDFLASYFGGSADFNNSGITSVQDIFDFLAAYFSGCS